MSKVIYRLTESELRRIIDESARRIVREQDASFMLQVIAQAVSQKGRLDVSVGEQDVEIPLDKDKSVYILFNVQSDPYMTKDTTTSSYEEPNSELIDEPSVEIIEMEVMKDDENFPIEDNGIVTKALNNVIVVDYGGSDISSEEDYYYRED